MSGLTPKCSSAPPYATRRLTTSSNTSRMPESPGGLAQGPEVAEVEGEHPRGALDRLHQDRRELPGVPLQQGDGGIGIVRRQYHEIGVLAPHHVFRRAVIPALQFGDPPPPGESPRGAHRHHDRFGARVGEPHPLQRADPLDQVPCESELSLGRTGEAGAQLDLATDRLHHRRRAIPVDQNRVIPGEVEQAISVEVHHPTAVTPHQHRGIGRMEERAAGIAAGQVPPELLELTAGGRRALAVLLRLVAHGSSIPSLSTQTFIAK